MVWLSVAQKMKKSCKKKPAEAGSLG